MAEHDRIVRSLQTSEWQMSNATFFTAFVAIAAADGLGASGWMREH